MASTAVATPTPLQVQAAQVRACKTHHPASGGSRMRADMVRMAEEELAWAGHESGAQPTLDTPSGKLPGSRRS